MKPPLAVSNSVFPDSGSYPGDQAVTEKFRLDWDCVLVGSEQVIVARLDGRGSGFRGQRYRSYVLSQLH